jgi:L-threonylcarbamoyladenylate synthase
VAEIGQDLAKAKQLLEAGELVAIPTETVYGLAGNALSAATVARIFEVKERPSFDPLIVHTTDIGRAARYVTTFPAKASQLAHRFWPGPLTLVLPRNQVIPDLVTSGLDTVGIRCPQHALTQQLLAALDFPLAAPSANPFGYISPTRPEHVNAQLGDRIAYILDGGACTVGIESTIVGFQQEQPVIYRMGGLGLEQIEETVGPVKTVLHSSSNPQAPGQLQSHYAPRKKLMVGNLRELLRAHNTQRCAILSFREDLGHPYQYVLSPTGKLSEAAQHLFTALRQLDQQPVDLIVAEWVPNTGLGRAINDRLARAAAQRD